MWDGEAGSPGSRPSAVTEELGAPARWLGFLHLSFSTSKMRGERPRGHEGLPQHCWPVISAMSSVRTTGKCLFFNLHPRRGQEVAYRRSRYPSDYLRVT